MSNDRWDLEALEGQMTHYFWLLYHQQRKPEERKCKQTLEN